MFSRRVARLPHLAVLRYLLRIGVAAGIMAGAVYGSWRVLEHVFGHASIGPQLIVALVPVVLGALVYAGACWMLRIEELSHFTGKLGRRLRR